MRIATVDDLDELQRMGLNFLEASPYKELGDKDIIRNVLTNIVKGDTREFIGIISPEVGFILGSATPFLFGPHLLATEIAWWVEPEARGTGEGLKLLEAFEYWAKNVVGAKLVSMTSLDKNVEKFYKKNGYKLYERAYMKVL